MTHRAPDLETVFPATCRALGPAAWQRCVQGCAATEGGPPDPARLPHSVAELAHEAPPWAADMARLEWAREDVRHAGGAPQEPPSALAVHPALRLVHTSWQGLPDLLEQADAPVQAAAAPVHLLVWPGPDGAVRCARATEEDLLALKLVAEALPLEQVAQEHEVSAAALRRILRRAAAKNLLLEPASLLVREESSHGRPQDAPHLPPEAWRAESFVLQWHVTQRCDLHCRHCYDRSPREDTSLDTGLRLLEELQDFCNQRRVRGQATLTGGNPLLHPNFSDFYKKTVALGLDVAVLGNPCGRDALDAMLQHATPAYYQISLEGLEEHNDAIRGPGHFRRSLAFLELLRHAGVPAHVMLTLTAANQDQVLPLARLLQGRADSFSFNRLAPVGEGASLACADAAGFRTFLQECLHAAEALPHLRCKDNLFTPLLREQGREPVGGCTGHGCGAAFNFLSVLGNGDAHACRKLHSPVGNVHAQGLAAVYDGERAAAYRRGSEACHGCDVRAECGGCLAVVQGLGQDCLGSRDPYCFYADAP